MLLEIQQPENRIVANFGERTSIYFYYKICKHSFILN